MSESSLSQMQTSSGVEALNSATATKRMKAYRRGRNKWKNCQTGKMKFLMAKTQAWRLKKKLNQ
jgi:hypothetical protein